MAVLFSLIVGLPGLPAQGATAGHRQHGPSIAQIDGDPRPEGLAGTIYETQHDLSLEGLTPCSYCHLTGANGDAVKPQWDSRQETVTYAAYGDTAVPPAAKWRPQGVTLVCLSCHDGTIGPDRIMASSIGVAGLNPISVAEIGTVFAGDHPVSVKIGSSGPGAFNVVDGWRIGSLPLYGGDDQVECASCHNPHDTTYGAFMRTARAGSGLCKSCHRK